MGGCVVGGLVGCMCGLAFELTVRISAKLPTMHLFTSLVTLYCCY